MSQANIQHFKPSDFAALGPPSCSRWGKSEIEWIAFAYVQALANEGDEWERLTREQTYELLTPDQRSEVHGLLSIEYDRYEHWFEMVARQIDSAEGALGVGGFWNIHRLSPRPPSEGGE